MHHLVSPLSIRSGFLFNWVSEWITYYKSFYFLYLKIDLILNYFFKSAFAVKKMAKHGYVLNRYKFFILNYLYNIKTYFEFFFIFKKRYFLKKKDINLQLKETIIHVNFLKKNLFKLNKLYKKNNLLIKKIKKYFFNFFINKKLKINIFNKIFINKKILIKNKLKKILKRLIINQKKIKIKKNKIKIKQKKLKLDKLHKYIWSLISKYICKHSLKKNKYILNLKYIYFFFNIIYHKLIFLTFFLNFIIINSIVYTDIKILFKKVFKINLKTFLNNIFIRRLKRSVISAYFISEYIKFRLIQHYSLNSIFKTITKALRIWKKLLGYKIQIFGRPFRTTRSRKFLLYKGNLKTNVFIKNIDYSFSIVRTKYGICGIKVWLNKYVK